jgi:hypothetical protein
MGHHLINMGNTGRYTIALVHLAAKERSSYHRHSPDGSKRIFLHFQQIYGLDINLPGNSKSAYLFKNNQDYAGSASFFVSPG